MYARRQGITKIIVVGIGKEGNSEPDKKATLWSVTVCMLPVRFPKMPLPFPMQTSLPSIPIVQLLIPTEKKNAVKKFKVPQCLCLFRITHPILVRFCVPIPSLSQHAALHISCTSIAPMTDAPCKLDVSGDMRLS